MAEAAVTLVGRQRELAQLADLVRAGPVVTVSGPGGVGKTSLAASAARLLVPDFEDGAVWCDLAATDPGPSVALAVAEALGGRDIPSDDVAEQLGALVAGLDVLLVLDNCEHVAETAAMVASRLAAGGAHVLATSRESLGSPGERTLTLAPLPVPADGGLEAVRASDAARLFVERAAAVRSDFDVRDDNAADIARVCRRLDGLPLALELAAARMRSLTAREIADRLDERFVLLTRRKGSPAERHRSLRAAVDWSYDLLSEPERALFERLGVFSTAVPLAAVEQVCDGAPLEHGLVLDVLDQLVDRSLITARDVAGTTRYGMLETLREYARERLADRQALDRLHARHADRYVAVADALRLEALRDGRAAASLDFSHIDEQLAALRWCLDHDAGPDRALRLLAPLWAVVHAHAAADITDLAERALARWPETSGPLRATVLGVAAVGHMVLARLDRARARALQAIDGETEAQPALIARRALAFVAYVSGDRAAAERELGEMVRRAEEHGAIWLSLEASGLCALVRASRGDAESGLALAAEVRTRAEQWGAPQLAAWATAILGAAQLGWGDRGDARRTLERGLELARATDSPLLAPLAAGLCLRHLGVIAALDGDRLAATARLTEALRHFRASGDRTQMWEVLRSVAVALAAAGDQGAAEQLLAGVDAAASARALAPVEQALLERVLPGRTAAPAPLPSPLEELTRLALDALASRQDAGSTTREPIQDRAAGVFRRDGPLWTLDYAGTVVRVPHLKGLSDLAVLLASPGREIHCLDLAAGGSAERVVAHREAPRTPPGDLGEVIDARA